MFMNRNSTNPRFEQGLVQVYTGNGKGKTTAAFGAALRATSHDFRVAFIQFLKPGTDAQLLSVMPKLYYKAFGRDCIANGWYHKLLAGEIPPPEVCAGWEEAQQCLLSGSFDLVILDELNVALAFKFLSVADVLEVLKKRPTHVEVIITGRQAPQELIEYADLVTEMQLIKHPYERQLPARQGIEF